MNSVTLIGRIGHDLELKTTQSGKSVVSFNLAVSRGFGKTDEVDWIRVTVWEKTAENLVAYQGKGDQIAVTGRLQTREYVDKEDKKRIQTVVVAGFVEFLSGGKTRQQKEVQGDALTELIGEAEDEDMPF